MKTRRRIILQIVPGAIAAAILCSAAARAVSDDTGRATATQQIEDPSRSTVGWFALGTGTVGITKGQTFRLSVVNLGPQQVTVLCSLINNPNLMQESFTLSPGESKDCDLEADDVPKALFDKTGRVQIRAFVRSSARGVYGNVEVFDNTTGRTSIILSLQDLGRQE